MGCGQDWVGYTNGNYNVSIDLNSGTKVKETIDPAEDTFRADFPDSMDIKISNRCPNGCPMCHENSTPDGELGKILGNPFIHSLHPYTEIALGGGEAVLHPDFIPFLTECKELELIPNVTTNQNTFMKLHGMLRELCDTGKLYGLGVSLVDPTPEFVEIVQTFPNSVVHVINGMVSIEQLEALKDRGLKILVLGYKTFRRGKQLYEVASEEIETKKNLMYDKLEEIIKDGWFNTISFDNLALQQLDVKRLLSEDEWNEFYMGDDGINGELTSASMYVDLVKNEFARNSVSVNRCPLEKLSGQEAFEILKNRA